MLNKFHEKQQGMELIILEQLVPQEHLLRKIDRSIDFSFIRRLCAPLYSANLGRPAIEPEVLFRMPLSPVPFFWVSRSFLFLLLYLYIRHAYSFFLMKNDR